MKRVKKVKGWGIYALNKKEVERYGFKYAVINPDLMECRYFLEPYDTDMEMETLEQAENWCNCYNKKGD